MQPIDRYHLLSGLKETLHLSRSDGHGASKVQHGEAGPDALRATDSGFMSLRGVRTSSTVQDGLVPLGLVPEAVVQGSAVPEPVRVAVVQQVGDRVRLMGQGLHTRTFVDVLLDKDQLADLLVSPPEGAFDGDPHHFRLGIEAQRLALAYEYDPYFSLSISRVDSLPHQVEAVYDFMLPLPRIRFLLADDAGAGKTIMAGLLLRELKLRGLVERTLIVTPANLAFQWQREMQDRFRETFEILRGIDLRSAYGVNPWQDKPQVITSIDWAKRDEVKLSLERARWDLIFVDEAHRMSAYDPEHKTERYRLGETLSERSDHLVLLTATPHKGDPDNFSLFLQLLDPDVYAEEGVRLGVILRDGEGRSSNPTGTMKGVAFGPNQQPSAPVGNGAQRTDQGLLAHVIRRVHEG
jgi:hypothetical protein